MQIALRPSNMLLILFLAVTVAAAANAQRRVEARDDAARARSMDGHVDRRVDTMEPEQVRKRDVEPNVDRVRRGTPAEDNAVRVRRDDQRQVRQQRACEYDGRRGRSENCDYYYDGSGEYYDASGQLMVGWSPGDPIPTASSAGATVRPSAAGPAKIAPDPSAEVYDESFSPQGGDAFRDALLDGRHDWMQKKKHLDDVNAAFARAEYEQEKTGKAIDPQLIARQKQAQQEAESSFSALQNVVEQARDAGTSPEFLEVFQRANAAD